VLRCRRTRESSLILVHAHHALRPCAISASVGGAEPSSSERPFDLPWIVIDSCKAADFRWKPERTLVSILDEIAVPVRAHSDWLSLCAPDQ
jgi:hypothetical protein